MKRRLDETIFSNRFLIVAQDFEKERQGSRMSSHGVIGEWDGSWIL